MSISFIIPVNDDNIYKNNVLSSPLFNNNKEYEIIPKYNYMSASKAYNDGIGEAINEILVFSHQDVIFPTTWAKDLLNAIDIINKYDPEWGVLGVYGIKQGGERVGFLYCNGNNKILGCKFSTPTEIQTLDEVVLVIKKSSKIAFDENLQYFHFYGSDICLIAKNAGRKSYAIPAFILHNSRKYYKFPKEFFSCYRYIRNKWKVYLPIYTSCVIINKNKFSFYLENMYIRKFKLIISRYIFKKKEIGSRHDNPLILLECIKGLEGLKKN